MHGAVAAGFGRDWDRAVAATGAAGLVFVLDEALDGVPALAPGGPLVYVGTVLPEAARGAAIVLPCANMAEEEGTFVNLRGRRQGYGQAKSPPGMARPAAWILDEVLAALGAGTGAAA